MTEYLVELFLNENVEVQTLSRGYGRKSRGFLEVFENSTTHQCGDEPLVYKDKFKDRIRVFVGEDRAAAVQRIREESNGLIILDDAFQHRKVTAGFNIVLTTWSAPYFRDHLIPAGNLREGKSGIKRADLLVVTKCPNPTDLKEKEFYIKKLNIPRERIFFASIDYCPLINASGEPRDLPKNVLLVTGIANPTPLIKHLETRSKIHHLKFPDHHSFNEDDLKRIHDIFNSFASVDKAIVTTEKDFVRIAGSETFERYKQNWLIQPIKTVIDRENDFKETVIEYVRAN